MTNSGDSDSTDREYAEWMVGNLELAAKKCAVRIVGPPVFGWRLRTVGAAVEQESGSNWLRVVTEDPRWLPGDFWTGNTDANRIAGLSKPRVLYSVEWEDRLWRRRARAELMSRMPGQACSRTDVVRKGLRLGTAWWAELRRTLDVVKATPTARVNAHLGKVEQYIRSAFGSDVEVRVDQWETVHGDLHWSNLCAPDFALLDWELWGTGPRGVDEATLYCHSLLVPDIERNVRHAFADQLDSASGRVAQLYVCARILRRAADDYPDLAEPIRSHAERLLAEPR